MARRIPAKTAAMKKGLLLGICVVLAAAASWLWRGDAKVTDAKLVTDRVWVDHVPKNDRDTIQVFAALTQEPVGVFQSASVWKGSYEVFRYEMTGGELRAVFPQNGDREKMTVHARRCNEQGMDYCLEIQGSHHGVKRYYSREGWEIGSLTDEDTLLRSLQPKALK